MTEINNNIIDIMHIYSLRTEIYVAGEFEI